MADFAKFIDSHEQLLCVFECKTTLAIVFCMHFLNGDFVDSNKVKTDLNDVCLYA